jgi:hypothetical protein
MAKFNIILQRVETSLLKLKSDIITSALRELRIL